VSEFKGRIEAFDERLRRAMDIRGVGKAELSRQTGIGEHRIEQYAGRGYEVGHSAVYVMAVALRVSPAWLSGYDVPMESVNNR